MITKQCLHQIFKHKALQRFWINKFSEDESQRDNDRLIESSETRGCGISWLCDPDALCHRLIALSLMSLLGFGAYFCMDNPGALQVVIDHFYEM